MTRETSTRNAINVAANLKTVETSSSLTFSCAASPVYTRGCSLVTDTSNCSAGTNTYAVFQQDGPRQAAVTTSLLGSRRLS